MRCNEQIRLSPIRLIDHEGTQKGVVPTDEALRLARDVGLDLVEVSPMERPPVCKIMDYGKHKYLQSKKEKHKHHEQKIKEVRMRPKTDVHDREIKMKHAREFLMEGDRVLFSMRFKGREKFHRDIGHAAFREIVESLADIAKVEQPASMLGMRMTMTVVPLKAPPPKKRHGAAGALAAKRPKKPRPDGGTGSAPGAEQPKPFGDTVLSGVQLPAQEPSPEAASS